MASLSAIKKLTVTSDTSGLVKGAKDVENYRQEVAKAGRETAKPLSPKADTSALAKGARDVDYYRQAVERANREFEKGFRPDPLAIGAFDALALHQRDVAQMTRAITAEMKPFSAELRKAHAETMKAIEADNKRALGLERTAEKLRMSYDGGYANAKRYAEVEEQVRTAIDARNLTAEQGNTILAGAGVRFKQMGTQAGAANENIRLTSHQTSNLGYQLNDVATMLAMGASPFQIISSQAGQVVQALGDGPGGVKGSLAAIGTSIASFARMMGPVGLAIAGATAATGALWWMSGGNEAEKAKNSVDEYRGLIDRLKDSYASVSSAAASVWDRAAIPTENIALGQLEDAARRAKDELEEANRLLAGADAVSLQTGTIGSARAVFELFNGEVSRARRELQDLYAQFTRGEIDARGLADETARIQISPTASPRTRELAGEVRLLAEQAGSAATNMEAIQTAIAAMTSGKEGRLTGGILGDIRERFGDVGSMLDRINPEGIDDIRSALTAQAEELTRTNEAANEYGKSLDALRSGWAQSAADLRLQVETFGQSAGAIARARFEHEALAEARKLAVDAGKLFDENGSDAARIREVAGEIGTLTDRLKALGDADAQAKRVAEVLADLRFQGSIIGMSDIDREVATTFNRLKLEAGTFDAQRIENQLRYNASLTQTQTHLEKQRELMSNIMSTGFDALFDTGSADSFFDRVMDGLADVGGPISNDISALFDEEAA